MHTPLGRVGNQSHKGLHVGQGLPRSISIGTAVPAQEAIDDVSNSWRSTLFEVGWLSVASAAADRAPSQRFAAKVTSLTRTDDAARDRLLSLVEVPDRQTGAVSTQSRRDFAAGLDRDYAGIPMMFLDSVFSPQALSITARNVHETVLQEEYDGLTLATVLVQLGDAQPVTALRGSAPRARTEGMLDAPNKPYF